MKLSDYRQTYYDFSGTLSSLVRTLAIAGIGIIWIFKFEQNGVPQIPKELFRPLLFLTLTIIFDFFQYLSSTMVWGIYQYREEKKLADINEDPELKASVWCNTPSLLFFIIKQVSLIAAYSLLFIYIRSKW